MFLPQIGERVAAGGAAENLAHRIGIRHDADDSSLQSTETIRTGMDELGIIDKEPLIVRVGRPAHATRQAFPQAARPSRHANGNGGLHHRPEIWTKSRFVNADNPVHFGFCPLSLDPGPLYEGNKGQMTCWPTISFRKSSTRKIPAQVVYEDDRCLAFRDANPQAPTHVLIVPRKAIATHDEIGEDDESILGHLHVVAAKLAKQLGLQDGYRLVLNCREQAGQTVPHLHLHLLGGRQFSWPPG